MLTVVDYIMVQKYLLPLSVRSSPSPHPCPYSIDAGFAHEPDVARGLGVDVTCVAPKKSCLPLALTTAPSRQGLLLPSRPQWKAPKLKSEWEIKLCCKLLRFGTGLLPQHNLPSGHAIITVHLTAVVQKWSEAAYYRTRSNFLMIASCHYFKNTIAIIT